MNDVPKFLGGHYWTGDDPDGRDFRLGHDTNGQHKRVIVRQVLGELQDEGWLSTERTEQPIEQLVEDAMASEGPIQQTWLVNLTEFGRDVHAEMSALMSAARRGVAVGGAHLYSTTFPCHNCAKHIIGAGIVRVCYVEPYAKSFAEDFHLDALQVGVAGDGCGTKVVFSPFAGVAPSRFASWFRMGERKDRGSGKALEWRSKSALPRFKVIDPGYISREIEIVDRILAKMKDVGVQLNKGSDDAADEESSAT